MNRIAVASQNRIEVASHAGRCRRFWIYEIEGGIIVEKKLLELSRDDTFHEKHGRSDHALDDVDALITRGMGPGLAQRLGEKGIRCIATSERDPDRAVAAYLEGSLETLPPHEHSHSGGKHPHGNTSL